MAPCTRAQHCLVEAVEAPPKPAVAAARYLDAEEKQEIELAISLGAPPPPASQSHPQWLRTDGTPAGFLGNALTPLEVQYFEALQSATPAPAPSDAAAHPEVQLVLSQAQPQSLCKQVCCTPGAQHRLESQLASRV